MRLWRGDFLSEYCTDTSFFVCIRSEELNLRLFSIAEYTAKTGQTKDLIPSPGLNQLLWLCCITTVAALESVGTKASSPEANRRVNRNFSYKYFLKVLKHGTG